MIVDFGDDVVSGTVLFLPHLKDLYLSFFKNHYNFNINAPKLKYLRAPFCLDTWLFRLLDNSRCITDVKMRCGIPIEDINPVERRSLDIILSKLSMTEDLNVHSSFFEVLTRANIPKSLPGPITSLKHLWLNSFDLCYICHVEGMLFLLRSSPNLESLTLTLRGLETLTDEDDDDYDGPDTYTFNRLETVEIIYLTGSVLEQQFKELLLANSPSLKKLTCKTTREFIDPQIFLDFAKDVEQFPRASTEANLRFMTS